MTDDPKARLRAEMILRVRSGEITATEAAKHLGVSRKTYYQWEKRGLEGMLGSLMEGSPGRPQAPKPDPEKEKLRLKVAELENKLEVMAEIHDLKDVLRDLRALDRPEKPPARSTKRRKKKR